MCMSFTDLSLDRQEDIWVHTTQLGVEASGGFRSAWAARAEAQGREVAAKYAAMSTDDLTTHRTMLTTEFGHHTAWALVIAAVDAELATRAAVAAPEPERWVLAGVS